MPHYITSNPVMGKTYADLVIALTSFAEEGLVQQALQAGAIGYLLKDIPAAELAQAIRAANAGDPTLSPAAARALIENANRTEAVSLALLHKLAP